MITKEYGELFESIAHSRKGIYEKMCKIAEKLPTAPTKGIGKSYAEAIEFSHMDVSPKGAFNAAILLMLVAIAFPLALVLAFDALSLPVLIIIAIGASGCFYYMYSYPFHYCSIFRIKASAEMVLSVVYMTIAMRISPNIENAVMYAAHNLTGTLAIDLKQLMWDVYTRKFNSMSDAMDSFINKWRRDNQEFTESVYLIKTSVFESQAKREEALDEAVSVVLSGTKERMKHYAQDLRSPITLLNALGIILPIIGMIFFPIMGMFLPNTIQPIFLVLGYDILLPISVYWLMKTYLEKRPYSFHQPDISRHPKFRSEKVMKYTLFALMASLPLIAFGVYGLWTTKETTGLGSLVYSMLVSVGASVSIFTYMISSVFNKLKLRDEIVKIEDEFTEALFQLGTQLSRGIPIETALKSTAPRIKNLKISRLFQNILYNIETFGMTLEQAIFNEECGAIRDYPSHLIEAVMKAIVEISKRGMGAVSKAMITISNYLKDVHTVEEDLREMLSEVTSSMYIQAMVLAPLSAAVVVAMAGLIMDMLSALQGTLESLYGNLSGYGPIGMAGTGFINSVFNLDQMMPMYVFQIIVGIYMIEVVSMLAAFLSIINNGDENLIKRMSIGKTLIIAIGVYASVLLLTYSVFSSLIPIASLIGGAT